MYHRFMSDLDDGYVLKQNDFKKQINFIQRHYTIVSLEHYLALPKNERLKIRNPLALTVDDGYRNFYLHAYPVLKEYSLPATMYLPYNFIEQGNWMWQDKNKYILRNARFKEFEFKWENKVYKYQVNTFKELINNMVRTYELCMRVTLKERDIFSQSFAEAAGIHLPERPIEEFAPLTWDEIREMELNGITFGSHTMNHEILIHTDSKNYIAEISNSKVELENRLGHEITGFCYPNGDYNIEIVNAVQNSGYSYAVTTRGGLNYLNDSFMLIRRESAPAQSSNIDMLKSFIFWPFLHHLSS